MPAEAETVAHRVGDVAFFWLERRVVEIAFGIRIRQVGCRGNDAFPDRLHAQNHLNSARRTERVAKLTFGAANRHGPG